MLPGSVFSKVNALKLSSLTVVLKVVRFICLIHFLVESLSNLHIGSAYFISLLDIVISIIDVVKSFCNLLGRIKKTVCFTNDKNSSLLTCNLYCLSSWGQSPAKSVPIKFHCKTLFNEASSNMDNTFKIVAMASEIPNLSPFLWRNISSYKYLFNFRAYPCCQ